jgi:hypothetical protein
MTAEISAARFQHLAGRLDIEDCLQRVCRGLDRGDLDLAISSFHADARVDYGTFGGAAEEVMARAMGLFDAGDYLSNALVEIDEDEAHAESYVWNAAVRSADAGMVYAGGRYIDRLERRDDRWGIVERACVVEWRTTSGIEVLDPLLLTPRRDRRDLSYMRPFHLSPRVT